MNAFERMYREEAEKVKVYLGHIAPKATEIFMAEIAKAIEAKNYKIANPWFAVFTQNKELATWWGEFYKSYMGVRRVDVLNHADAQCIFWDEDHFDFKTPVDLYI